MLLCGVTLIAQLSLRGSSVADACTQRDSLLSKYQQLYHFWSSVYSINVFSMLRPLFIFLYQILLSPICSCNNFYICFYFTWPYFFMSKIILCEKLFYRKILISFSFVALHSKVTFKQILANLCVKTKETPYIVNSTVINLVNGHTVECITVD